MTSSAQGGSRNKNSPLFIEPLVESGISSLPIPQNYFVVFDIRGITDNLIGYLAHNLTYDALQMYGNGSFQFWQDGTSFSARLYSTEAQIYRFLSLCKESMRVWGLREPSVTFYRTEPPQKF